MSCFFHFSTYVVVFLSLSLSSHRAVYSYTVYSFTSRRSRHRSVKVVVDQFLSGEARITSTYKILCSFWSKNLVWSQNNLEFLMVLAIFLIFSGISKILLYFLLKRILSELHDWEEYCLTYQEKQESGQNAVKVVDYCFNSIFLANPLL